MKKTTLQFTLVFLLAIVFNVNAQVLNQNANWPNANWSLSGTYTAAPGAVEADPTVDANFAFDDDDAGNGSDDSIAAESPTIDVTAAFNAGETWLSVSLDYVYRKLSVEEFLRIQYFDADSGLWENWEPDSMPGNDTVLQDDFCTGTPVAYTSVILNIAGFTPTQQSGFRYRFLFDDDPNGAAWEWGFCLNSPTIMSETPPLCPDPSNLMAANITDTSADLSWDENGSASLYDVEVVTTGTPATGTPTTAGVANPYTQMGLTPETSYDFYVRADCGGDGVSMWVGPMSFTTACAPIVAPYTEDFENFTTGPDAFVSENCWTGTGGAYYWEAAPGDDAGSGGTGPSPTITTGNYFYTEASAGAGGDTTDLIAPLVDLSPLTNPSLSFDYHMFGGEIGTLEVWVNGVVEWSLSGEQQTLDTEDWRSGLINLSAYAGQTIAVIFRGTSAGVFEGDIAIDNVSFDELPSCPDPSMLMASNITDTTAELSWTEVGTATLWNIEIVDITGGGTPTGTPTVSGVTNPYVAMGLTQDNDYEYYVQSDCGGETSNWVGPLAFRTLETCPAPFGMTTTGLTETSADLSWTAGNAETAWNIEWNSGADFTPGNGDEEGSVSPTTNPETTLSGLTAATTYFVYYQADCGGDVSAWVGPFTFYTGHCIPIGTSALTFIDNFSTTNGITNISNLGSGLATDNYQDNFDTLEVSGFATGAFDFNVEIVGGTLGCAIWVDWNNDLLFDVSEVQFTTTGFGNGPFTGSITIPGGTPNGEYRMRVMVDWNDPEPGDNDACSFAAGRGEVEDYKVVVGDAPTDILDFYSLWFPPNGNIGIGSEFNVFAQCFEAGLTDTTAGQAPGIECWIGYSDMDTDPSGAGWTWIPADFNVEVGNNDEYFIDLGGQINATGTFYYAARWRLNGGVFTYGGIQADGAFGGEWGDNNNISGVLTVNPPVNDDCPGAIALTPGADFDENPIDGTVAGATLAGETADCGLNGPGVWYSVVVPNDGNITIETGPDAATGNTAFDSVIEAYSGTCGALTLIECDDDGSGNFNFSILDLTGLVPGETIYIRVWEFGGDETEPFAISAYNATLSLNEFDLNNSLTYFPNPVKNELTLKSTSIIQNVSIFNMLGQEVITTKPNDLEDLINMSDLNDGTYFVQVTMNDITKTVKIIKN